jgi:asparagine synthase (glutamine-hydrolysing)
MAGIAGLICADAEKETVKQMLDKIKHRGPDNINIHQCGGFCGGVAASELSQERGNGYARDGEVAVLFDGDIYNERNENVSDAEVALSLYKKHGRGFGGYLEGVFACAVCDGDEIILARDAVGVRPLYYGTSADGSICFASEMKALTGPAENVYELLPCTTFSFKNGVAGYICHYPDLVIPEEAGEAAEKLRQCLTEAVHRRMRDGAVGACLLSGGLDSSIIAAIASESDGDLPMITVGVEGSPDLRNAELMARHLGAKHEVFIFDAERIEDIIPDAVYTLESFDEDCISGTIANLFASATAAKRANCILSGEGGDELFGGYHLLKKLRTEGQRLKMMEKLIEIAYNTAVQRLDRAMMGNSINYRTPFIDSEVIAFSMQTPVGWKIHDAGNGRLVEKWILREAFKDMLHEEIYRREKLRFSGGTGTDGLLDSIAAGKIDGTEFNDDSRTTAAGYCLNSLKELWYYRIFKEKFPLIDCEKLVGRWDPYK